MKQKGSRPVSGILVLGAFYLLYTAFQLADTLWSGESSHMALGAAGAVLFAAAGIGILIREWRAWRAIQKAAKEEREDV